jgi:hypothetical protein
LRRERERKMTEMIEMIEKIKQRENEYGKKRAGRREI